MLNVTTLRLGLSSIIILHRLPPAKPVAVRLRHHNGLRVGFFVGDGRSDNTSDPARRSQPSGPQSYRFPQRKRLRSAWIVRLTGSAVLITRFRSTAIYRVIVSSTLTSSSRSVVGIGSHPTGEVDVGAG